MVVQVSALLVRRESIWRNLSLSLVKEEGALAFARRTIILFGLSKTRPKAVNVWVSKQGWVTYAVMWMLSRCSLQFPSNNSDELVQSSGDLV